MQKEYSLDSTEFPSLKSVSQKMFDLIADQLNVNTAYITKRGSNEMTVISTFNKKEEIIPEGFSVEYSDTYCRKIIMNEEDALCTEDLTKDVMTKELEVTSRLQMKGFLGVTLTDLNGNVFGTLCVMDPEEKIFSQEDVDYLKAMGEVLAHIIELDHTQYNLGFLNVPIIPVRKGISILPVQGIIDEKRAEIITRTVLEYAAAQKIEHLVIDLSGLVIVDGEFPHVFINVIHALKLMGVNILLTGISPAIARHELNNNEILKMNIHISRNLESALEYIGFHLQSQ
ncbi:rsbT co-antagonist protein RsbR [Marinococcus luteus]|uniref:RsbT co-antagonist protein RsbR n=1 Tax=Marinococcus luteus TaxID=1122204 RepID=A0A1H2X1N6_9BACI|nr:STAS domain-containing protein [Marinococcus luteus]SDW86727.1 rsbT co-antagonist protein RsbR [Marinococcus luteus]